MSPSVNGRPSGSAKLYLSSKHSNLNLTTKEIENVLTSYIFCMRTKFAGRTVVSENRSNVNYTRSVLSVSVIAANNSKSRTFSDKNEDKRDLSRPFLDWDLKNPFLYQYYKLLQINNVA